MRGRFPAVAVAMCVFIVTGCSVPTDASNESGASDDGASPENQPPYPVIGGIDDDDDITDGIQQRIHFLSPGEGPWTLQIDLDSQGRADPDGDTVQFASNPELYGSSPGLQYLTLDRDTGEVQFVPDGSVHQDTVHFFTIDEHGASSESSSFTVVFDVFAS